MGVYAASRGLRVRPWGRAAAAAVTPRGTKSCRVVRVSFYMHCESSHRWLGKHHSSSFVFRSGHLLLFRCSVMIITAVARANMEGSCVLKVYKGFVFSERT